MKKTNKPYIGSSFDEFLEEEGILSEVTALAYKRILAWQIKQAMKSQTRDSIRDG